MPLGQPTGKSVSNSLGCQTSLPTSSACEQGRPVSQLLCDGRSLLGQASLSERSLMASCLSAGFDFSHPLLVFLHFGSFLQVVWGFCFAPEALLSLLSHSLSYHLVAHRVGIMKLCVAVTGSGSPVTSKNADMNRLVSVGIIWDIICHPARMPGVLSMTSSVFAATSIDGGSTSSTA